MYDRCYISYNYIISMKKILFRKLLSDCFNFFILVLISISLIIWVFQAVNFLDILVEDGRDYMVYLNVTLLNLPKIISKVLPFSIFFGFIYIYSKYEINNEMMIFWNFGVKKINLINFFLIFSFLIMIFQLILTSVIVPKTQNIARVMLKESNFQVIVNFIKEKKFNDNIKDLTIYVEKKDKNDQLNNIYLKKQNENNFQITIAKNGFFENNNGTNILVLLDGETINFTNEKITSFRFSSTKYNLKDSVTNTITNTKTQEMKTTTLINCLIEYKKNNSSHKKINNCEKKNFENIYGELYKRLIIPFYIPVIILVTNFLIYISKETENFIRIRNIIFLIGFLLIIVSEIMLRIIRDNLTDNLFIALLPLTLLIIIYLSYLFSFKSKVKR